MKKLFFLLSLMCTVLNVYSQGIVIQRSGSGGGSGTAAFTNLTSAGGGQSVILSNNGTNVVLYSLTNNGPSSALTITTNANSIVLTLVVNTNDISEVTNSYTINTLQTNTTTNVLFVVNSIKLTPTATEGAKASLVIETNSGSGVYQQLAEIGEPGATGVFATTNDLVAFISPGSRFYVTNQSVGSATAAIITGFRQYLFASPISGGGGSGTVTSVAVTSSDITVGGSPITTSGTITLALPWSTNLFTDTNMFRLATNGMISMFITYTNVGVDTNMFRGATNVMTDTNIFRLATNGILSAFTTFTNIAVDTNMFSGMYDKVTTLTYDGVETTVMLVDGSSNTKVFRGNITKNTTLRFTNFWNGALTNASRPCEIGLRQDSSGTWTVGTQLTNALVAFGVGGTNTGIRSNANTISWISGRGGLFTNSMIQLSVVTNSVP